MTIGFDAKRLFANRSGLGNYSRTLVRSLLRFGPDELRVHLYTPRVDARIDVADVTGDPRVTVHRPPTGWPGALWRSYGVTRRFRADGLDVFHGLSHELPLKLAETGVAGVVTIHDLIYRRYPEQFEAWDRRVYDLKFGHAVAQAQRVVAISEQTKADLLARYPALAPDRVRVVYQSCGEAFAELPRHKVVEATLAARGLRRGYLLYVGSFVARKRPELVPEIAAGLPDDLRPDSIVFVGRGPDAYREDVRAAAERRGFTAHVLTDVDDDRELVALYRGAAALVYPSVYEGFGIPVAEGLLAGIPVVTTRTGALEEAGGPHAFYGEPDAAASLASALAEALRLSKAAREARMAAGRAYAKTQFGAEARARELLALYREMLS